VNRNVRFGPLAFGPRISVKQVPWNLCALRLLLRLHDAIPLPRSPLCAKRVGSDAGAVLFSPGVTRPRALSCAASAVWDLHCRKK